MKKILCPVNFTPTAFNALEWACKLAGLHAAAITLLHVVSKKEYKLVFEPPKGSSESHNSLKKELESRLERLCEEVRNETPAVDSCHYLVRGGELVEEIHRHSREGAYDLIVMGNEGVQDVTEAVDGSRLVKVIEQAPCPVLCVPYLAAYKGFRRVVYGTKFNQADKQALSQLRLLLEPAQSTIDVLHLQKVELEEEEQKRNKKRLAEFRSDKLDPRLHTQLYNTSSKIPLGLDSYMKEAGADLLVLLTHQRNFGERIFQKSVFKRMSYFADYPLLVYLEENL